MFKKSTSSNVETVERRMLWRDRRTENDRRCLARLNLQTDECRSVLPRRVADISGELNDGAVW